VIIFVPLDKTYWLEMPDEARPRYCQDTKGIVALSTEGEVQGICIMDTWSHNACQVHMYIKNPMVLKHGFLEEIGNFVFGEKSGRELIIGVTPADNKKALRFNRHIGLVENHRIKDGYAKGIDYVITTMRKEHCRWIEQPVQLELAAVGG
jgi:hypothetical protein